MLLPLGFPHPWYVISLPGSCLSCLVMAVSRLLVIPLSGPWQHSSDAHRQGCKERTRERPGTTRSQRHIQSTGHSFVPTPGLLALVLVDPLALSAVPRPHIASQHFSALFPQHPQSAGSHPSLSPLLLPVRMRSAFPSNFLLELILDRIASLMSPENQK